MATPQALFDGDERLPLILGFQRIGDNTSQKTRFIEYGKGIYVYDTDGREYIEATSSFYVAALGYMHEELVDAIKSQYHDLPFITCALGRTSKTSLDLAERLVDILPVSNSHVLFGVSGSEAIDYLIKLLRFQSIARGLPERQTIIGRHGSYHGGTLASASLTGGHHEEFGLPLAGFRHVSQPDYHGEREPGETAEFFSRRLARELEELIGAEPEGSVAAFFAEPISFSAGFKIPPDPYFPAITEVLRRHNIDFVVDEVITGFGRTGAMFGSDTFALSPDCMTIAKGITSGYFPLSAVAVGAELYNDLELGSDNVGTLAHASTFAAHPVGAAAALAVLEIIERDNLIEHARKMGEKLAVGLHAFTDHPIVGDVRCLGLAGSLDFLRRDSADEPINDEASANETACKVYEGLLKEGVISRPAGRSIVLAPPLIVEESEIIEICKRLGRALDAAVT